MAVSWAGWQGCAIPPVIEGARPWTSMRAGARNSALRYCAMVQGPAIFSSSTKTPRSAITEIPVIFIMLQAGIPSDRLSSSRASLSCGNVSSSSSLQTVACSILPPPPPPPHQPPTALSVDAVAWRPPCDGQLGGKRWLNNLNWLLKAAVVIVIWQAVTAETATHLECDS